MKKNRLSKTAIPTALCAGACLAGTAYAQTPAQVSALRSFIGDRAEVAVILGASDSAGGGNYTVDGRNGNEDTEFSLFKFGGAAELGKPRPLPNSPATWSPYVFGNFGYLSGDNDITAGPLNGNSFEETGIGIQLGGGIALHVTERFTVTPYVGMIYGHYEMDFHAHNAAGNAVKPLVEDSLDTIGATPGISLAYAMPIDTTTLTFSAKYTYYGTTDISSDTDIEVGGSSHILEQRVDADVPLNASLWGCRLHTGGYVALTEPLGDIKDTMRSDYWGTIHPRLLWDTAGKLWKVDKIGLGASYIKGEHFDGWDIGVDINFKF